MGYYSPSKPASGKLIHIKDFESYDTHFGCSGTISEAEAEEGTWVALIARGKCSDIIKVKLAERYHASAVIFYNKNYIEQEMPVDVFGKMDFLI